MNFVLIYILWRQIDGEQSDIPTLDKESNLISSDN